MKRSMKGPVKANVTDPVADLLTRIRNGQLARHERTRAPGSKLSLAIANVMKEHGYIGDVTWSDEGHQGVIDIQLRYLPDGTPLIRGIRRESKPGQRMYVKKKEIPRVLNGLGISILSTSRGIITGKQAREASTGGELLATVW